MKTLKFFVAACIAASACGSWAQWQWVDQSGRNVFSDRGPGPEVPEKNIVQRPVIVRKAPSASPTTAPASAAKDAGTDKTSANTPELAQDGATRNKAEEERVAKTRAENCRIAQQTRAALTAGVRLTRLNAAGEQEVLDEAGRAAEAKRMQSVIDSDCK